MKKIFLLAYLSMIIISCKNQNKEESADQKKDSLTSIPQPTETLYAEDLININSHEDVVKKYGQNNVIKGRFFYADDVEGTPATIIFKGTDKEITIEWKETINYKSLLSINIMPYIKTDTAMLIYTSQWQTKKGLKLGMPLNEVVQLNGKDFTIGGLGWDYGGGVISWNGGNLSKDSNISVVFTDTETKNGVSLSEAEQNQINGEGVQINSSNKALQKLNPVISSIFINKK